MRILSAEQMREADRRTVDAGHASWLDLMESAGRAVVDAAFHLAPTAQHFFVVCGKGNNGGDGLVAARHLAYRAKEVTVLLCAREGELSRDASAMFARLDEHGAAGVKVHVATTTTELHRREVTAGFENADLVIDALLGTGLKPPVESFYAEVIAAMNASGKKVLAVDLPSGADADAQSHGLQVRADSVVTFTAPKRWHVWAHESDLPTAMAQIGTPVSLVEEIAADGARLFTPQDLGDRFFDRRADSNKGNYGHVLAVAGSLGKSGAAVLCGTAALRAGAGLVTVACPGAVLDSIAGHAPEVMTEPLDGRQSDFVSGRALSAVLRLAESRSVLAVGPGLGRARETESFVHALVAQCAIPMVLDADGLNAFEQAPHALAKHTSELVITPHPGEMARLLGLRVPEVQADRSGIAQRFAQTHRCTVVLKGWRTVVAFPDGEVWVNPTGNPGMATGGTGDALTGITAALLAQKPQEWKQAVLAAVFLHGMAGDIAAEKMGVPGVLASDLINAVPEAIRSMKQLQRSRLCWLHVGA